MRIDLFIHQSGTSLDSLNGKLEKIMATQAELAATLRALTEQLVKARGEIVAAVDRLVAIIGQQGITNQEVDDAVAALTSAVQGLDDLNPDEPTSG